MKATLGVPTRDRRQASSGSLSAWSRPSFLLAAVLCAPAGLRAELPLPMTFGGVRAPSIPFARLSAEEGLSQGTVNCILQDHVGFLWLGTQDGLNRYDGYGFQVYKNDPADPTSLPDNWIEVLVEDRSGNLWIGTESGGLARWQPATDTFTRFQHRPDDSASLPSNRVRALRFDRAGSLWVGTFQSGLARFDPETGTFERFRHSPDDDGSLSDDRVRAIYEDRAGVLWVGTLSGLDRFDQGSFFHVRHDPADSASLSDNRVISIVEDHQGDLWIGTEHGLNRRTDPGPSGSSRFVRYLSDPADPTSLSHDLVWALFEDNAHRLWVGTDRGLNLLRGRDDTVGDDTFSDDTFSDDTFTRYLHDNADPRSLSNDRIMSIFQDRGGVLWFGTQGGGINKWNPLTWSFAHYRADSADSASLSHDAVHAFAEDSGGRLWVGTYGGGLNVLDRATGKFTYYRHDPADPASLASDQVSALLHDRGGFLWIGTAAHGLDRFVPDSGTFRHFRHDPGRPGALSDDAVSALFEDRSGRLWVATFRGGLNRFAAATPDRHAPDRHAPTFVSFRHDPDLPESLGNDSLTALAADADGFLWVGTFGSGLDRFKGGAFQHFRRDPARPTSLSNDVVYALHVDDGGSIWVGTRVGLNRLESVDEASGEATFKHYFERDGLPSDAIWGIYSDSRGMLWLSTNYGISKLDPRGGSVKNYDRSHGLQGDEFNFGAHFQSSEDELFFGGTNGFNAFSPDRIESNTAVPPVVLTAFTKLNQPVLLTQPIFEVEEVFLDYLDDIISFEFAALDYTAPEMNRYRFMLEGFHDEWLDLGHRRRVNFTNLDPRRYVLRIQGSNNDGVWNESGASIEIMIRPPFWQTWWFRLTSFLTATGILLVAHHRRVENAKRRQQELAELARAAEREQLIARLEAKNAELERFTYTVSHDLKAPLLTIKGFLGYLRQDAAAGNDERLQQDIERIDSAAGKMNALLSDLLELSRIGRMVNPPETVPLGDLAREAAELVAGQIDEGGVELRIMPDLPEVLADRSRIVEVLQNLLDNAMKYMGDQPSPQVEVGATQSGPQTVFFVRDNGIGIAPEYQGQIFDLFQRLSADVEGTGVGLALVRRIVEFHGGRVWAESDGPGCGSTFCFTLGDDSEKPSLPTPLRIHK